MSKVSTGKVSLENTVTARIGIYVEGRGYVAFIPHADFGDSVGEAENQANAEAMAAGLELAQQGINPADLKKAAEYYQLIQDAALSMHAENWHRKSGHKAEIYNKLKDAL